MVLQPNLVSWCTLMPPFCVPNFKVTESFHAISFHGNFHTLMKRRKKNREKKEIKPIFKYSYLENAWHDMVKIWNVRW